MPQIDASRQAWRGADRGSDRMDLSGAIGGVPPGGHKQLFTQTFSPDALLGSSTRKRARENSQRELWACTGVGRSYLTYPFINSVSFGAFPPSASSPTWFAANVDTIGAQGEALLNGSRNTNRG
jgi:hypothetical protein